MAQSGTVRRSQLSKFDGKIRARRGISFAPIAVIAALIGVNGCGGTSDPGREVTESVQCSRDADCASGKICRLPSTRTQIVAPCPYQICTATTVCPTDQVCARLGTIKDPGSYAYLCGSVEAICSAKCQIAGCLTGFACQADGTCRRLLCNEQGALACPSTHACDPIAAATEPLNVSGSSVVDDAAAIVRGCVRKRCNEAGGFICRTGWTCEPNSATDASGCAPIPCSTGGNASMICPTGKRCSPSQIGADVHGCVVDSNGAGGAGGATNTTATNRGGAGGITSTTLLPSGGSGAGSSTSPSGGNTTIGGSGTTIVGDPPTNNGGSYGLGGATTSGTATATGGSTVTAALGICGDP